MFTGIVECVGRLAERDATQDAICTYWIGTDGPGTTYTTATENQDATKNDGDDDAFVRPLKLGDSVAVNGVCLTVTALRPRAFQCQLAPETLKRTNLGMLPFAGHADCGLNF